MLPSKSKGECNYWLWIHIVIGTIVFAILVDLALAGNNEDVEEPFGATAIINEATDNNFELQVFVDGFLWKSLQEYTPRERNIFTLRSKRNINCQGGLSGSTR